MTLEQLWARLAAILAHPLVAVIAVVFVSGWFAGSVVTGGGMLFDHGRFDPGMSIGSFVSNAIQLVVMFVTLSCAQHAAHDARSAKREAHDAHAHARASHVHSFETHVAADPEAAASAEARVTQILAKESEPEPLRRHRKAHNPAS